jgi:hypothetical protein
MISERLKYAIWSIITLVSALGIRKLWRHLPFWINIWIGDFLWAMMLYWAIVAFFMPKNRWRATLYLIVFSWFIEASQAFHTPWLDAFRSTTFGSLLLGQGFLWSDIFAYTFGALCAYLLDNWANRSPKS